MGDVEMLVLTGVLSAVFFSVLARMAFAMHRRMCKPALCVGGPRGESGARPNLAARGRMADCGRDPYFCAAVLCLAPSHSLHRRR